MSVALSPPHGYLLGEKRTFANKVASGKMKEKFSGILQKLLGEME